MLSISRLLIDLCYKCSIFSAVQMTIAVILSFFASILFHQLLHIPIDTQTLIGALWAMISAIMVTQVSFKESLSAAWVRVVASIVGAILPAIFITFLGYHWIALALTLFFEIILCSLLNINAAYRSACITSVVIFIVGKISPELGIWLNTILRFAESMIGAGIAILISLPFKPLEGLITKLYSEGER